MALYQVVEQNGQKSLIDVAAGGGSVAVPAPYNTEVWITESGTWTAPVTGDYEVLLIGGGYGATWNATLSVGASGDSGDYIHKLLHFTVGDAVQVTIGIGGPSSTNECNDHYGGRTIFGDIQTSLAHELSYRGFPCLVAKDNIVGVPGSGFGGGSVFNAVDAVQIDGREYGAGGAFSGSNQLGAGKQGAIRLRYYDPNKTSTN